jgi:integrase
MGVSHGSSVSEPTPKLRRGRWEIVVRKDVQDSEGNVQRVQQRIVLGTEADLRSVQQARRAAEPILSQLNSTLSRPQRVSRFADFARLWSETVVPEMKPSTQVALRSILRVHLVPAFGDRLFQDFTPELVQGYIAKLRGAVADKTGWNILMCLRSLWNSARAWQYTTLDLFTAVRLRLPEAPEVRCFTLDEVRQILVAAPEPDRFLYWLAAETGMRRGELCGLSWSDVDVISGVVRVSRSAWAGKVGTPKTRRSVRTFAISLELAGALGALRLRDPNAVYVFHTRNGAPLDGSLFVKRKLQPLLKALHIAAGGLHSFRHFNASAMDRMRAPVAVMQSRLGHSNFSTTEKYLHSVSADDRETAKTIGSTLVQ